MLRCYDVTLAYIRTPLKNRKYITCNIYLYICGGWGCFLMVEHNIYVAHRSRHPRPKNEMRKNPSNLRFKGVFAFGRMFRRLSEKSRSEGRFWAFYALDCLKTLGFSELAFEYALESLCQYPRNLRPLFFNNPFGQ